MAAAEHGGILIAEEKMFKTTEKCDHRLIRDGRVRTLVS